MTCEYAKEQLVLEAYGELDAERQAALALHLHACPDCVIEHHAVAALTGLMDTDAMPEVSPNLLAQSRMRLDEALDETPQLPFLDRVRNLFSGAWHSVSSAPLWQRCWSALAFWVAPDSAATRLHTCCIPHPPPLWCSSRRRAALQT